MISGFLDPWEPFFMDLNIPEYFSKYKQIWDPLLNLSYINLKFLEITALEHFGKVGH